MVKPEILWAYAKTSQDGDELFLGKLLRHLAGHSVEFSSTERLAANALMQSNEWHTESIESKKERDALYQRINRLEKLLKEHGIEVPKKSKGDSQCQIDKSLSISLTHSLTHSLSHSPEKEVCETPRGRVCARAHTHAREFDFDAAGLAAELQLPLAYVAECVKKWGAADWVTTQGKQITPKTIRAHLLAFWQNEKDKAAYTKSPKPARKHTAKEVADAKALCAENCANFKGGKCGAGVAVLPALLNPPRPPQECKHFKKS